jgi:hypothetical protein
MVSLRAHARFALLVGCTAFFFSSRAHTAPAGLAPTPTPIVAPGVSAAVSSAPTIVYPPANATYEDTNALGHVTVETSWTTSVPEADIYDFQVCYFKAGASCPPEGSANHYGVAPSFRHFGLGIPLLAGQPAAWKWQVAVCRKKSATVNLSGPCTWSEPRGVNVVPKLASPDPIAPAAGVTLSLPASLEFTWKPVAGAQFYRFCDQTATFLGSWQCPATVGANGAAYTLTKTDKPIFVKSFTTPAEISSLTGPGHDLKRTWGAEACHMVMEQQQDKPPVEVAHCTQANPRRYTASRTP